ncbi:MAG TPA: type II secretion system F family protein [Longimicrobiales bacterium]|nr:type II secretion system F family protein [Longimicrobiales bacterium]
MIYLVAVLIAATVGLVVYAVAQAVPARPAVIGRRLAELELAGTSGAFEAVQRNSRMKRRERWEAILQELGERTVRAETDQSEVRRRLTQAGFQSPGAPAVYWGVRVVLPLALAGVAVLFLTPLLGGLGVLAGLMAAVFGWLVPSFYLDGRISKRQKELRMALPDTLDLLVTTVEAGLGLNHAMVRVAQEINQLSPQMARELTLVNLEIRAGRTREEALRGLGERSGVDDLRSLATMLIQTDRFGTSVAQALRVHADTMRVKRKQRAEEAAAKTAVKILFPLLVFIFPALFVVLMGPAAINIYNTLLQVD